MCWLKNKGEDLYKNVSHTLSLNYQKLGSLTLLFSNRWQWLILKSQKISIIIKPIFSTIYSPIFCIFLPAKKILSYLSYKNKSSLNMLFQLNRSNFCEILIWLPPNNHSQRTALPFPSSWEPLLYSDWKRTLKSFKWYVLVLYTNPTILTIIPHTY